MRIPEVLSEIRKVKLQAKLQNQDPVMAFLGLNDFKNANLKGSFEDWVAVVQKGLFSRLRKSGFKYSGLFKRARLQSSLSLESVFVPLLQSKSSLEIYVIGPGFDDLKTHIEKIKKKFHLHCDVMFIDVISEDKKLRWFWAEIVDPPPADFQIESIDSLRH